MLHGQLEDTAASRKADGLMALWQHLVASADLPSDEPLDITKPAEHALVSGLLSCAGSHCFLQYKTSRRAGA